MKSIIESYVRLLVNEAIHQERPAGVKASKFLFQEFKNLKSNKEMIDYAKARLKLLGQGSSRITFLFTNRHVLKIALNNAGYAQNTAELDVATNPAMKPVISQLKDYDQNGAWLVQEMVREVNEQEFESLSGVEFETFCNILESHVTSSPSAQKRLISRLSTKAQSWVQSILRMIEVANLLEGDFMKIEHWGKTVTNRIVLMDYGYTDDVQKRHYSNSTYAQTQLAPTEKA